MSRWMIGYGFVLFAAVAATTMWPLRFGPPENLRLAGWGGGVLMVAAGFAAAQGRRSLRKGGLYIGLLLPLALSGLFSWQAAKIWRNVAADLATASQGVLTSFLALASIFTLWIVTRLRPREGIATRGYAVPIPSSNGHGNGGGSAPSQPTLLREPARSSEFR